MQIFLFNPHQLKPNFYKVQHQIFIMPKYPYRRLPQQRLSNERERRTQNTRIHHRRYLSKRYQVQQNHSQQVLRLPRFIHSSSTHHPQSQVMSQLDQIPTYTFTITMKINNVIYQLIYPQSPTSMTQVCQIISPGLLISSLSFPQILPDTIDLEPISMATDCTNASMGSICLEPPEHTHNSPTTKSSDLCHETIQYSTSYDPRDISSISS